MTTPAAMEFLLISAPSERDAITMGTFAPTRTPACSEVLVMNASAL